MGDGVRKEEHKTTKTLCVIYCIGIMYTFLGKISFYIITYWSFSRQKINNLPTSLGICTEHRIKFFYFLMSRPMSFRNLPPPLSLPISSPFYVGHYPYSSASCQKFIALRWLPQLLSDCAKAESPYCALAPLQVSFVLRLFAKTRNLTFFLSSVGFLSHENSDEISINFWSLQEYIYIYI